MDRKIISIFVFLLLAAGLAFFFWRTGDETASARFRQFSDPLNGYSIVYPIDWRAESDAKNGWLWLFLAGMTIEDWLVNVQVSNFTSKERAERAVASYLEVGGLLGRPAALDGIPGWDGFNQKRDGIYQIIAAKEARTYVIEARPVNGELTPEQKNIIASFKFAP